MERDGNLIEASADLNKQAPYLSVQRYHKNGTVKASYAFKEEYALVEAGYSRIQGDIPIVKARACSLSDSVCPPHLTLPVSYIALWRTRSADHDIHHRSLLGPLPHMHMINSASGAGLLQGPPGPERRGAAFHGPDLRQDGEHQLFLSNCSLPGTLLPGSHQ